MSSPPVVPALNLSRFILANLEPILQQWEDFARSLEPGRLMTVRALRDDAERMLRFIAADIQTDQSVEQEFDKSRGLGPQLPAGEDSAAHLHGVTRAVEHFSVMEMVSEYRALRASVTRMWLDAAPLTHESVRQLVRFNEAVDQILAESILRFTAKLDSDADLFTASIGHDLRNPLSAVVMAARTLMTSPALADRERTAVARIQDSAANIAGMLNDLSDFTRTRLGSILGYERERSNVAELCRAVVEELQTAYLMRTITFSESGDTTALVDTKRVRQLLSNLVANAIQPGSEDSIIAIRATSKDEEVTIEVHNEGPVIEPDELEKIFEPLLRGRTRKGGDSSSLDLGLYIARRIALAHGGSVNVTSTQTEGTTFVAKIPQLGTTTAK